MLVNPKRRDIGQFLRDTWQFAGRAGTVTVTGAGSNWTNAGTVVVGGQGTGTLTIQDGGTVNSAGGSVGLLPARLVR